MAKREVNPVVAIAILIIVLVFVGYLFYSRGVRREESRGAPAEFYQYQKRGANSPVPPSAPR